MSDTTTYRIDVENDTATLIVGGVTARHDLIVIVNRCRELPAHVVMLRIDLRPLGVMSASDGGLVRAVLDAWRQTRGGRFQLTTSHLVATCRQVTAPPTPAWSSMTHRKSSEGLVAAWPDPLAGTSCSSRRNAMIARC